MAECTACHGTGRTSIPFEPASIKICDTCYGSGRVETAPREPDSRLSRIAKLQADLDVLDNEITRRIDSIEATLRGLISVSIAVDCPALAKNPGQAFLRFGKLSGAWRLIVTRSGHDEDVTLAAMSRHDRAVAFSSGAVTALVDSIVTQLESEIRDRGTAITAADKAAESLKS